MEEEAEITKQTARGDASEKQLRISEAEGTKSRRSIAWLQSRVKTLLSHLMRLTQIGKVLEGREAKATANAATANSQLAKSQRLRKQDEQASLAMQEELRKLRADKASEEESIQALQRQNRGLLEHAKELEKREHTMQRESNALKDQLRQKVAQQEAAEKDLKEARAALDEVGSKNIQVNNKYADSLKSIVLTEAASK